VGPAGGVEGVRGTTIDITELAETRQALAAREPFLPSHRESLAGRSILKIAERIV
jgi:hypothetical protein